MPQSWTGPSTFLRWPVPAGAGDAAVPAAVAVTVSLTLAVTVVAAKAVGCCLPILAKGLGLDPAVMASPFITTLVDAISLLTYFGIASLLLEI